MIGTAFFDEEDNHEMRNALLLILEARFGRLSSAAVEKVRSWPAESLADQAKATIKAKTLQELGLDEATLYRKE